MAEESSASSEELAMPSAKLLVTAGFIDTAIGIFNSEIQEEKIYVTLFLLMLITAYTSLNKNILSFIDLKFDWKLVIIYKSQMAEKRAKLKYQHIEDNDIWDLITRTCEDPVGRVKEGFGNLLNAVSLVIEIFSKLLILMRQVAWAAAAIVAISIPLFIVAIKSGKEVYQASQEAEKCRRRADYLKKVLQGRENVEERALFSYTDILNKKWHEKYLAATKVSLRTELMRFLKMKASGMITILLFFIISCVLLVPLSKGQITIGMFMSLILGVLSLIRIIAWRLTYTMSEIAKNKEYMKDLTSFCALSET